MSLYGCNKGGNKGKVSLESEKESSKTKGGEKWPAIEGETLHCFWTGGKDRGITADTDTSSSAGDSSAFW